MWRKSTELDRIVDIHCHILPTLDDGSGSMEETLEMLQIAVDAGITDIIATPHFKAGRHNASTATIRKRLIEVHRAAEQNGIYVNLYPGNEIFFFSELEEAIEEGRICTMNQSQYVLIEFSPTDSYRHIRNALEHVMSLELFPIIAHVERYGCMLEDWTNVESIRAMGTEIQINAPSIAGEVGPKVKKFTGRLLDKHLVDYIGTDAHDSKSRTPDIQKCLKQLLKRYEFSYVEKILCGNAMKLLSPQEL